SWSKPFKTGELSPGLLPTQSHGVICGVQISDPSGCTRTFFWTPGGSGQPFTIAAMSWFVPFPWPQSMKSVACDTCSATRRQIFGSVGSEFDSPWIDVVMYRLGFAPAAYAFAPAVAMGALVVPTSIHCSGPVSNGGLLQAFVPFVPDISRCFAGFPVES